MDVVIHHYYFAHNCERSHHFWYMFLRLEENYAATFTDDTTEIVIYNIYNLNDAFRESLWRKSAPIGRTKMEAYLRDI